MILAKRINQGEASPTGYRVAWFDWKRNQTVYYPVGFHLIAWLVRWLWVKSFWCRSDAWDQQCLKIEFAYAERLRKKDEVIRKAYKSINAAVLKMHQVNDSSQKPSRHVEGLLHRANNLSAELYQALDK